MVAGTPQSCKAKGRKLQQELRDILISELGIDPLDIESTAMGQSGCDLYLSKAARSKFPFGVEAKYRESIYIWQAMKQAEDNAAKEGLIPLLVFRRSRSPTYVTLRMNDFLNLVKNGRCPIW